jgi:VIT1/CCC1 family predicted Fe2+/Mn2+ transporter
LRTEGSQKIPQLRNFVRFPAARQLRFPGFPKDGDAEEMLFLRDSNSRSHRKSISSARDDNLPKKELSVYKQGTRFCNTSGKKSPFGFWKAEFCSIPSKPWLRTKKGVSRYNTSIMENYDIYLMHAQNELTEHIIYHKLAAREKNPDNKLLLEKLSLQEKTHHDFWKGLAGGDKEIKPRAMGIWGTILLRDILGVTFITKFLELHEKGAVTEYQKLLPSIPLSHRKRFEEIIRDEEFHERSFIGQLKEKRIAYVGFIVLGLADAIVEITGVHAGFLGVTGSTLLAGISGVIVGFAAAISMGSAAYLQAKQDTEKSPFVSAAATGVSYLCSVICLALPYFLIRTMLTAFTLSTSVGILLIAGFTYYGAVVFDRKFWSEFGEAVALMLGTAGATFVVGTIAGKIFHLNARNF